MTDEKFVDVDGIKTRYFEKGNGPVLFLVHGGQARLNSRYLDSEPGDRQKNSCGLWILN